MADHRSSESWLPEWAIVPLACLFMFAVFAAGLAGLAVAVYFFFRA